MIRAIHFLALHRSTMMSSGYLKQNIGQVKHAYAEAVHPVAKTQVGAHSEIGEGNVDAIDEIHDVDQKHERKQPARNSAACSNAGFW
jgi:hypothetical protein